MKSMKILFSMLAVFVLLFSGCAKDPVAADLEAFDKLGKSVFQDTHLGVINQKVLQAKTNEERAAALDDLIKIMEEKSEKLSTFKAQTPEVGKITDAFNQGIRQSLQGAKRAKTAFQSENQAELGTASKEMQAGQKTVQDAVAEYIKLAKEKGLKIGK